MFYVDLNEDNLTIYGFRVLGKSVFHGFITRSSGTIFDGRIKINNDIPKIKGRNYDFFFDEENIQLLLKNTQLLLKNTTSLCFLRTSLRHKTFIKISAQYKQHYWCI